jgi:ribosomal protein S18 acetylase RimI-like enzyme
MTPGSIDPALKLHFREYTPEDLDACLGIFRSNQDLLPDPPEILSDFLAQGTSWFLVGELEGSVVACGGLEILGDSNSASLVFNLVDRRHQRRGIGSLLTLTELTLAPEEQPTALVTLEAPVRVEAFYHRFGFERMRPNERRHAGAHAHVDLVDLGMWLTSEKREDIRRTLASLPITYADGILASA